MASNFMKRVIRTNVLLFTFCLLINYQCYSAFIVENIVQGRHKEGFPTQAFCVNEDSKGNIWLSSEFGVFKFDRLICKRQNWFDNKSEVLKIFSFGGLICFVHHNFDLTLIDGNDYRYIKANEFNVFKGLTFQDLLDVNFNSVSKDLYFLIKVNKDSKNKLQLFRISLINNQTNVVFLMDVPFLLHSYEIRFKSKSISVGAFDKSNRELITYNYDSIYNLSSESHEKTKNQKIIRLNSYDIVIGERNSFKVIDHKNGGVYKLEFEGEFSNAIEDYEGNIWLASPQTGVWYFEMNIFQTTSLKISEFGYGKRIDVQKNERIKFSKKHGFYIDSLNIMNANLIYSEKRVSITSKSDTVAIGYDDVKLMNQNSMLRSRINDFCITQKFIYVGLENGLFRYFRNGKIISKISNMRITSLVSLNNKKEALFASKNGIFKLDSNGQIARYFISEDVIQCIESDKNGIYYSTIDGVFLIDSHKNKRRVSDLSQIKYIFSYKNILYLADNRFIYLKNFQYGSKSKGLILNTFINSAGKKGDCYILVNKTLNFFTYLKSNYNKFGIIQYWIISKKDTIIRGSTEQGWVSLTNLKCGEFKLLIKGVNDLSVSSKMEAFCFNIPPEFYETLFYKRFLFLWSIFLILSLGVFIGNIQKKKVHKFNLILENENIKLQLLKSQLNPHFLFNSLNSLKSLIYSKSPHIALGYLDKLSFFLRDVLISNNSLTTDIGSEINVIENYIMIENFRLEGKIELNLKLKEDCKKLSIPSNILQPIVENSLKYCNKDYIKLNITIKKHNKVISIIISDNGTGIKKIVTHESFSLKAIKRRIDAFNRNTNVESLSLSNLYEGDEIVGVVTTINISET